MRSACQNCPFRRGSPLGYDRDAMEALRDGNEPSCHMVVGIYAIFSAPQMVPAEHAACVGYRAWCAGVRGFVKPRLVEGDADPRNGRVSAEGLYH